MINFFPPHTQKKHDNQNLALIFSARIIQGVIEIDGNSLNFDRIFVGFTIDR